MKQSIKMSVFFVAAIALMMTGRVVRAEEKFDTKTHVEMHEKMAKAHGDAAECVKSAGDDQKAVDKCVETFHKAKAGCPCHGEKGQGKCKDGKCKRGEMGCKHGKNN